MKEIELLHWEASLRRVGIQFRGFALIHPVLLTHMTQLTFLADEDKIAHSFHF